MWVLYNEQTNYLCECTNCLHGKAAEPTVFTEITCSITTTKYIELSRSQRT